MSNPNDGKPWTFVTSHGQVLLCIWRDPQVRMRDVAEAVGITERAAQRILADLVDAGYVSRERVGRRNHYSVNHSAPMRHTAQEGLHVGDLLDLLSAATGPARQRASS